LAQPKWLVPAILVTGVVVLWSGMASAKSNPSTVQTANVGNRVYNVVRLGQGHYLVTLVSTGGVIESSPVNFAFSQVGPIGSVGSPAKLAQLQQDLPNMSLNFAS
jgi:hypothetical protein